MAPNVSSEGRAAVYGLLGALIGGLATFAGAYWTGHQTQSLAQSTAERSAYVTFAAAADQYEINLSQLPQNLAKGNSSYGQIRANLVAEIPSLYSDAILLELSSNQTLTKDARMVLTTLFSVYTPNDPASLNVSEVNNISNIFDKELGQLESDEAALVKGH